MEGYDFKGWSKSGTFTVTADTTITGYFSLKYFTLTKTPVNAWINSEKSVYQYSETGTLTATFGANTGYQIKSIEIDGTALTGDELKRAIADGSYTFDMKSDHSIKVVARQIEAVVTTVGGTWTYDGQAHGATVTVTGLPDGYTAEAACSTTVTHASSTAVTATYTSLVVLDPDGNDVTDSIKITRKDGTLKIDPAVLTVTTETAYKTYDATDLTAGGTITGFVNGETATFQVTGKQRFVGSSKNTYSLTWDGTARKSDYTIEENLGTLTVEKYTGIITVSTVGGTFKYDGQAHGAVVVVRGLPSGYTYQASSNASATHVAEGMVEAKCDVLHIYSNGVDVTETLTDNITYVNGSISITPATLTVTTGSASKVYDGTALMAGGTVTGYIGEETATFTVTGSQTAVGSSENNYTLTFDKTATESDYTMSATLGKLTVTEYAEEITVTTTGGTFTYDGKAHGAAVTVSTLPTGYTVETATSDDTATHVAEGIVEATCDTLVIKNAAGEDVTGKLNIKYVDGSITINPATLTVTTGSASKVYDGIALTATGSVTGYIGEETATFTVTGTQTAVGSSDNSYTLTFDKTAAKSDYTVSATLGKLTVTEYADEITVTTTGGTFTYDGQAHGATVAVSTLPTGYTVETATSDDEATHVAEGTVTATCDTLVIKNAAGEDVTDKLNIKYVDGSIIINPATLTVTTESASKVYDGTALTAGGSVNGYIGEETATFTVTGTQTAVGSSENTYTLTFDKSAAESDYTVSATLGKLTVTEYADEITVITTGGTFTYDGQAHGATVAVSTLPNGYTLDTATSDDTATHVADGTVTATCDTLVIKNAAGEDVTDKLNIKYMDGSITITPASLTVITESASKVYDGTALTATGSVAGYIGEETATFKVTGTQTAVGFSENTYTLTFDKTATESDYTMSATLGKLTVTEYAEEITVTTTGGTFTYDGQAHGAIVTVSELPTGYTVGTATSDDAATHVAEGTVTATCDTLVIKNAAGEDVTGKLNIKYVDGSITINPVAITLTSADAKKPYDGTPLTKDDVSITGSFVDGEGYTSSCTGTQTLVGSSNNTFTYQLNAGTAAADYDIAIVLGKLVVTD